MNFPFLVLLGYLFFQPVQEWKLVAEIKGEYSFFTTDNLQQLYIVRGAEVEKYSSDGNLLFRYSDKQLGDVTGLDVSYSLRPLVFYKDLNNLVMLDNTLSNPGGVARLMEHDLGTASLAATSVNNHFWFYDFRNFELVRTDENFKRIKTTGNLGHLLNIQLDPNFLLETNNWVYLNNPEDGILVFDIYGTYYKTLPFKGLKDFQIRGEELYYFQNNKLYLYHLNRINEEIISIPEIEGKTENVHAEEDKLYIGNGQTVYIFKKAK